MIMVNMVLLSEKEGRLQIKDMVLELDFTPDIDGTIPILREPPQYRMFAASKYLETQVAASSQQGFAESLNDRSNCHLHLCTCLKENLTGSQFLQS